MTAEAARWGTELKRVMSDRRVPVQTLADAVGTAESVISEYRRGFRLPSMERATRIAEALATPHLAKLCATLRTRTCDECGKRFVEDHRGGLRQKWCSRPCTERGRYRQTAGTITVKRYDFWRTKAERANDAIWDFCWSCEPEGACREPGCRLREESPLPVVSGVDVPVAFSGVIRLDSDDPRRIERQRAQNREAARRARERKRGAA